MNTTTPHSDDDSDALEGFERLRKEAEAEGIKQDAPLGAAAIAALGDMAPANLTVGQVRSISAGVQHALDLARGASAQYTRDEDAGHVDAIVKALEEVAGLLTSTGA